MSLVKCSCLFLVMVAYTLADESSLLGLSVEGTLEDVGEVVDGTVNSLNVGKREAPEPEVETRVLGLLGGLMGRKKRQAEQVQTRMLDGLLGRKKRQAEQVQTRMLDGLLGRKKRQAEQVQARMLDGLLGRKKRQAEQVQTRILGGLMGRKKRQVEQVQTRILGGLMGRKKRDLTLDQLVDIADILQ